MSSFLSLVKDGNLRLGSDGADVRALQIALQSAGYRADITSGTFTDDTDYWVRRFQKQHGLVADGIVGPITAALLDAPHSDLVNTATPTMATGDWPHDDTSSLISFYGKPWENADLLTRVPVSFAMTYEGSPVKSILFHVKAADALKRALDQIAERSKTDASVLRHVSRYSGSYNYRPIRGSSRLSCHAFGAAIDFDAEHLPMTHSPVSASIMPQEVVDAFKSVGAFWGGDYRSRRDPMHFQFAHE